MSSGSSMVIVRAVTLSHPDANAYAVPVTSI
jgi:hypothetical protein